MIYPVIKNTKLFMNSSTKSSLIGSGIGMLAGGIGGALYDSKKNKNEKGWKKHKGAILGALGGGVLGGAAGLGHSKFFPKNKSAGEVKQLTSGGKHLLQEKNPEINSDYLSEMWRKEVSKFKNNSIDKTELMKQRGKLSELAKKHGVDLATFMSSNYTSKGSYRY